MKKISLYLLIFTMLYCLCACGKNSDAKSNSREDDGRREQKIIISSIQVASNTKVMRAKVFLPNVKSLEGTNYWLGGLDTTSKVDVIDTGDGIQINVCGFYSDDTAWKNPKVYKGFQSPDNSNTPLKNVLVKGKVVPMKEKMLKADVKKTKKTIPVEITPYTVSICPVNDWREKGCFYHVVATTKDGKQYSIGELPLTDDRKGTEKKKHPFMDGTDLEELGDGYASASEMKYCGARYIFNQKIDITQIEQIEIIKYKISR